jgi:hypothetical protein
VSCCCLSLMSMERRIEDGSNAVQGLLCGLCDGIDMLHVKWDNFLCTCPARKFATKLPLQPSC